MRVTESPSGYRMPPQAIVDLVDAPLTPHVHLNPARTWMMVMAPAAFPSVAELARPELRLAGIRIDPDANGLSRQQYYVGLTLKQIVDGAERTVKGLPEAARIGYVRWASDGSRFAFTVRDERGIALWVGEVETGALRPLTEPRLNAVLGTPYSWTPDGQGLICTLVPADRSARPQAPSVPEGPVVQENIGREAPSRTYQDLLKNAYDEDLFEYYATSQAAWVSLDGDVQPIGPTGLLCPVRPSPDGAYLLAESLHRPFSYLVPYHRFAHRVEVWNRGGEVVRELADLPLAEEVPIAFDAVPEGPRAFSWRADAPSTVVWVEAQDRGDPRREIEPRDCLYALSAPFDGESMLLASLGLRYAGITWGHDNLALISERWWKTRWTRTWRLDPSAPEALHLLFDRSWEDRYSDPGSPLTRWTPDGTQVLLTGEERRTLYFVGAGASPEGDRPFLDRLDVETGETERLWRSEGPCYEHPVHLIDVERLQLMTRREAIAEPPNFFLRDLPRDELRQITAFPHPTPQLASVHKELIRYPRNDGVQLTATLYLPPGHAPEDGPLPMLMWAYPREFKSADAAGQVTSSPYRFVRPDWGSPLFLLAHGYAVLEGPTMPIVGEGEQEANDTYVEQLVASSTAAVEEVVRRGVADRNRIAAGGHSYGAFMTANLLAHTDLFRAGIARSGAFNRTLTPFGFQAEERTLWEAPEVYAAMSPFMHVHKIKAPLLLIHGEADNNSGTFPIQSERFYNALKGHGATVRLVMLPHESHGYRARESVMHMLWEMTEWLDRYVKHAEA